MSWKSFIMLIFCENGIDFFFGFRSDSGDKFTVGVGHIKFGTHTH